jgi:hypothetical protein
VSGKTALDLTPSGLRGRLKKFGMDLQEKPGKFRVYRATVIAEFGTVEELRAFVYGAEVVVPMIAESGD